MLEHFFFSKACIQRIYHDNFTSTYSYKKGVASRLPQRRLPRNHAALVDAWRLLA